MHTEEQARQKWCPHARDSVEGAGSFNRIRGEASSTCLCLGSGCVMWEFIDELNSDGEIPFNGSRNRPKLKDRRGDCGFKSWLFT